MSISELKRITAVLDELKPTWHLSALEDDDERKIYFEQTFPDRGKVRAKIEWSLSGSSILVEQDNVCIIRKGYPSEDLGDLLRGLLGGSEHLYLRSYITRIAEPILKERRQAKLREKQNAEKTKEMFFKTGSDSGQSQSTGCVIPLFFAVTLLGLLGRVVKAWCE